ncbi:MAG: C-terminal binding protein [Candidatus Latescibacteria bacterium]|nr:C-terminal binding protein [Candidatus Latescibacterota bacterium]
MTRPADLTQFNVLRLNARLFPVSEYEIELFEKYQLNVTELETDTRGELIPHVADCDALFVVSASLPTEVIESLSRCRVISRLGTGTDKIDVATATEKGILVTNIPEFCIEEQADHTMALLLTLARQLPRMRQSMVEGAWTRSREEANTNRRLSTQTLGLVGFGGSARETAKRARGFGMRVLATRSRRDVSSAVADSLGVEMTDLDTLLSQSDFVSLHLPLNSKTYHMFDEQVLSKMKPGAFFINTARGALVDESALAMLLRNKQIAGAGIDTFEQIDVHSGLESAPNHPLLTLENVVFTPHVAALSVESKRDNNRGGIENLAAVLSGFWPTAGHVVNPSVTPRFPLIVEED